MPCNYAEYHPKWSLISRLIRYHRAGNRCEACGVPNGAHIYRPGPDKSRWVIARGQEHLRHHKVSRVTLTVAHLDHNKLNNRFANLKALCNRCHLLHDIQQHHWSRKYGRATKYQNGRLFE